MCIKFLKVQYILLICLSAIEPLNADEKKQIKGCWCGPTEPCWPSKQEWTKLNTTVNGRLRLPVSPFAACLDKKNLKDNPESCQAAVNNFKQDPFWLQTFSGATQSTGQAGAWTASQSEYVVEALNEDDISAAVKFAAHHKLRLVVKGTGHDYYGRSNAPNSLLIWTYNMKQLEFHDTFKPEGCSDTESYGAVTTGAGLTWMDVYAEATPRNLYVQGGGCTSVGVVGFTIGGGYGSFSKMYGMAASNLLQATVITADGKKVIASKCQNSDLFYALRGGGFGFGVVSSLTFRTFPLPKSFISTGESYVLIKESRYLPDFFYLFFTFYDLDFSGSKWGDQLRILPTPSALYPDAWTVQFRMMATNLTLNEAEASWDRIKINLEGWKRRAYPEWNIKLEEIPAKDYWTLNNPATVQSPYNSKEPNRTFYWDGDHREVSEYWLFALNSRYLRFDQISTRDDARRLANFLVELPKLPSSIPVAIPLNKGQYKASQHALDQLKDMPFASNVKESIGLILVSFGVRYYNPNIPNKFQYNTSDLNLVKSLCGTEDLQNCSSMERFKEAMNNLRKATPGAGSYFNQADYFEPDFQTNFWGKEEYTKLLKIKEKWDPNGLYYCHHCVGSEPWNGTCYKKPKKNVESGSVPNSFASVTKLIILMHLVLVYFFM
ncbi:uncharacterized protein [Clytia hemisphaerica]|uniref:FAD-binding PCMH-type domain-containing protein n=1 Tax=Clytia hemisphaerica TaxID=252671 RepID=A0A7M5V692_9CNID